MMQIQPFYRANDEIKKLLSETDKYFAFQEIDTLFDKDWCDGVMNSIVASHPGAFLRSQFIIGQELGNTKNPNIKYYLLIC